MNTRKYKTQKNKLRKHKVRTQKTRKHKVRKPKFRKKKTRKNKVYKSKDFKSGDGMLTTVWGPSLWHFLHTMSFNYPVKPTHQEKKSYRKFILSLEKILPCKYCRLNLKNNLKQLPLTMSKMKNRYTFSKYIYDLHEKVNKMLGKTSGLKYCDVRERYEHFRSRCTIDIELKQYEMKKILNKTRKQSKKETGCTEPLYGKKSKCIIKIVPQETKCKTFQMDDKCRFSKKSAAK